MTIPNRIFPRLAIDPEIPMQPPGEDSAVWLERVARDSPNPEARILANFALDEWIRLRKHKKLHRNHSQVSLWDLLAGLDVVVHSDKHRAEMSVYPCANEKFYFPIFIETHARRKISTPCPDFAVLADVPIRGARAPQVRKWGYGDKA